MLGAGGNFVLEKFKEFCRNLNMKQVVSSSCHHQWTGGSVHHIHKVDTQKCFDTNADIIVDLINSTQARSLQSCIIIIQPTCK